MVRNFGIALILGVSFVSTLCAQNDAFRDASNRIPAISASDLSLSEFFNHTGGDPGPNAPYSSNAWQDQGAAPAQAGNATSGGGSGSGAAEANNPGVPLSQFQFQNVFVPESYGGSGYANSFIVQPVIAINCKPDSFFPYHIVRATLPILEPVPDPDGPRPDLGGTGDITYFDLYFHKTRKKGVVWGIGPVAILPTAANPGLFTGIRQTGLGEWQLGPAAAVIDSSRKGWVFGALVEVPFSLESDAYTVEVQPILTRLLKNEWYVGVGDLLWKFDDHDGNYNFPLSFKVGKVVKAGKQPINIFVQPEYTPIGLTSQPTSKYGIKLSVTFLLPGAEFGYNAERAAKRRCGHGCHGCHHCR